MTVAPFSFGFATGAASHAGASVTKASRTNRRIIVHSFMAWHQLSTVCYPSAFVRGEATHARDHLASTRNLLFFPFERQGPEYLRNHYRRSHGSKRRNRFRSRNPHYERSDRVYPRYQ